MVVGRGDAIDPMYLGQDVSGLRGNIILNVSNSEGRAGLVKEGFTHIVGASWGPEPNHDTPFSSYCGEYVHIFITSHSR